jgi:hypothetical protein
VDKTRIKVYCYNPHDGTMWPDVLEVDAYCVGGSDGVFAVFQHPEIPERFCIAKGDDGHWQLSEQFHHNWLPKLIEALTCFHNQVAR